MSAPGNTPIPAVAAGEPDRLLWLQAECKGALRMMWTRLEAGMSATGAVQDAYREIETAYKAACNLEGVKIKNASLDPVSVSLQARFALDAALLAIKGGADEHEARKAFWALMRLATNKSAVV